MMDNHLNDPMELTEKQQIEAEWQRISLNREIHPTERMILRAVWENPGASQAVIAEITGLREEVVRRRLAKPSVIRARMVIEGSVSDLMLAAAHKYALVVNRTLDRQTEDPEALLDRLWTKYGEDPEAFKRAVALASKGYDPQLAHEMGKTAVAYLAKEAEIQLKGREVEVKERQVPMVPAEARRILEADIAGQPDIVVEIPDL